MDEKKFKYVGKGYPIHDAELKAAGRPIYAGDMELPGMLYMALLTSSIPSGAIKSMDCAAALAYPGVVKILTYENTTAKKYNRYRTFRSQELYEQETVFAREIRFAGDKIAGVIAESMSAAKEALKLINVEYDETTPVYSVAEVFDDKAKSLHSAGGALIADTVDLGEEVAAEGAECVSLNVGLQRMTHCTMETHSAVADFKHESRELTLWAACQSVFGIRTIITDLFDLPFNKVRVIKTTMGGSFGGKQEAIAEPYAAAGAIATGRPVKVVFTRAQSMVSAYVRTPFDTNVSIKSKKDGSFLNMDIRTELDAGAYISSTYNYGVTTGAKICRVYKTPHIVYNTRMACTNTPVSGGFRSWGAAEMNTMVELSVDRLAVKLGMDPLALRKKNIVHSNDFDYKVGVSLGDIALEECIDRGAAAFGWDELRAKTDGGRRYRYGAGMAIGGHVNGYFPYKFDFGEMTLRMNEDATFQLLASLHDHGCGAVMEFRIILAEALGVDVSRITTSEADTAVTPLDPGCYSSRTTYVLGRAAYECANKMLELIKAQGGRMLDLPPEHLACENGEVYGIYHNSKRVRWADIAETSMVKYNMDMRVSCNYVNSSCPGVYGVHFARVRVDTYTGLTDVVKYVAVQDIGQAINPSLVVAQVQGAVQQGIGAALSEEIKVDQKTGRTTDSLKNYHLINSAAMPDVQVILVEDGGNFGPFGAKSLGEVSITPVSAAVTNAVNHALGSEFSRLPVTQDKILAYLNGEVTI